MQSDTNNEINSENISSKFLKIEAEQCEKLNLIEFDDPVCYVYNPLDYAKNTHEDYVKKYGNTKKSIIFLGMNPGPFGMAQNGVPFGECKTVRDWLKIEGTVSKPDREHPNRPIYGLECPRSEVSGRRFWGFIQEHSKTPETFFLKNFVHNYCPLAFLAKSGKNITPPELKAETRNALIRICDETLCSIVQLLGVETVIGVGKFAAQRAQVALKNKDTAHIKIGFIMHPSPVNPAANKGWDLVVKKQLIDLELMDFLSG